MRMSSLSSSASSKSLTAPMPALRRTGSVRDAECPTEGLNLGVHSIVERPGMGREVIGGDAEVEADEKNAAMVAVMEVGLVDLAMELGFLLVFAAVQNSSVTSSRLKPSIA